MSQPKDYESIPAVDATTVDSNEVEGRWKDGLCDCFSPGCCHPSCLLPCCCLPLAAAQVMTRMNMNWKASPGSTEEVAKTFVIVLVSFVVVQIFVSFNTTTTVEKLDPSDAEAIGLDPDTYVSHSVVSPFGQLIQAIWGIYVLYIVIVTRMAIRKKYKIPAKCCGDGVEDFCCACFCSCCTVSQMARHTADYDLYEAKCCTKTGLSPTAPALV